MMQNNITEFMVSAENCFVNIKFLLIYKTVIKNR